MYKRILVTVDLADETSWQRALPVAVNLAENFNAELHVMTVVPELSYGAVSVYFADNFEADASAKTEEGLKQLTASQIPSERNAQVHVSMGTIYKEILRKAGELKVDLIVMASHRPELSDYLLGPNAGRVTRHADCSVMVVRD